MNAQKFTSESISQAYFTHKLITSKMKKFLMAPHRERKRKTENFQIIFYITLGISPTQDDNHH